MVDPEQTMQRLVDSAIPRPVENPAKNPWGSNPQWMIVTTDDRIFPEKSMAGTEQNEELEDDFPSQKGFFMFQPLFFFFFRGE